MPLSFRIFIGLAAAAFGWSLVEILDVRVEAQPTTCIDDESRVHIRAVTLEAIDAAYKDQVQHLFEIWMKDPKEQPARAQVGIQNAIKAHSEARKLALAWMPPQCPN